MVSKNIQEVGFSYHRIIAFSILSIVLLGIFFFEEEKAYGALTEWKSGISVGILESDNSLHGIPIKVSTYSEKGLKLEWSEPEISDEQIVTGYEIWRKSINHEYEIIVDNSNSTLTAYFDLELPEGYYGYKVIPITEKKSSDQITMHGIGRQSNLFNTYVLGQELLAQKTLNEVLNGKSIQNNSLEEPITHYSNSLKRSEDPVLQNQILIEISKAQKLFYQNFGVQINH